MSERWTRFMDMHSGGGQKGPADKILIEAPESEARVIFYNRFGLNPDRVSCTCCGEDYSVSESPSLEEATAFDRNCFTAWFFEDDDSMVPGQKPSRFGERLGEWNQQLRQQMFDGRPIETRYVERGESRGYSRYRTLDEYLSGDEALVVRADEITAEERIGSVPQSGYVWLEG